MSNLKMSIAAFLLASTQTANTAIARTVDAGSMAEPRVVVPYGDLDLSSKAGADELRRRVIGAAYRVNGDVDNRDPAQVAAFQKARGAALAAANAIITAAPAQRVTASAKAPAKLR